MKLPPLLALCALAVLAGPAVALPDSSEPGHQCSLTSDSAYALPGQEGTNERNKAIVEHMKRNKSNGIVIPKTAALRADDPLCPADFWNYLAKNHFGPRVFNEKDVDVLLDGNHPLKDQKDALFAFQANYQAFDRLVSRAETLASQIRQTRDQVADPANASAAKDAKIAQISQVLAEAGKPLINVTGGTREFKYSVAPGCDHKPGGDCTGDDPMAYVPSQLLKGGPLYEQLADTLQQIALSPLVQPLLEPAFRDTWFTNDNIEGDRPAPHNFNPIMMTKLYVDDKHCAGDSGTPVFCDWAPHVGNDLVRYLRSSRSAVNAVNEMVRTIGSTDAKCPAVSDHSGDAAHLACDHNSGPVAKLLANINGPIVPSKQDPAKQGQVDKKTADLMKQFNAAFPGLSSFGNTSTPAGGSGSGVPPPAPPPAQPNAPPAQLPRSLRTFSAPPPPPAYDVSY